MYEDIKNKAFTTLSKYKYFALHAKLAIIDAYLAGLDLGTILTGSEKEKLLVELREYFGIE